MLRTLVCATLTLVLATGVSLAADKAAKGKGKKGGHGAHGTVAKVDASTGTLTLTIKNKKNKDGIEKEFKITDDAKVVFFAKGVKNEVSVKEGLSKIKVGDKVAIRKDKSGAVTVLVNAPQKAKGNKKPKANK
jgi:Cu/Ag efflux protein CusF